MRQICPLYAGSLAPEQICLVSSCPNGYQHDKLRWTYPWPPTAYLIYVTVVWTSLREVELGVVETAEDPRRPQCYAVLC